MTLESAAPAPEVASREPVSRTWLLLFALAWFGFWLLVMLPGQFMVVKLASVIDPAEKVAIGSFLITEMALVIVVGVPLIGWLCDRTRTRFGRRRTWALGGLIVATAPFAFVGQQTSWAGAAVLLGLVALGEAAVLVALSAIIADQVPEAQRGRASAAMGVPQVFALALGMIIVTELVTDVGTSWLVIAVLALLTPLPFLLAFPEPAPQDKPARARRSLWRRASWAGYGDLGWAGLSRVLINAGNLVGTTYLLFFLADVLLLPDPDGSLMILILFYLGGCAIASWLGGVLTDRFRARRVFIALCAGLQAAAALLLAFVPTWDASIVAAVLLGVGYGMFLSVDQALLTDVLPDSETRARDLGIVNSAQHLPIAPLVGWAVLTVAGYTELYIVAAVIMIIGGLVVFRVRSVR
ncbi:MFS transporter [Microbacterium sp. NC79]|uniref:MFS transporter n=1 Tax=Microbacterium sp. NC79 TaxID=2851009 RepID=UPI001C2C5C73|nr:MFS transporter [Microbacterium sp. NC79]MBV0895145.1 MFS transporter [Microbacterium sp. NC79]